MTTMHPLVRCIVIAACAACVPGLSSAQESSELTLPPNGDNQKAEISQWIGLVRISISYHSPRVHFQGRARTGHIWGELIPYGLYDEGFGPSKAAPWRAGANESTVITVSHDLKVGGKELRAGTYALFLELARTGPWYWIFSSNPGWGSFQYDPADEVIRVPAVPTDAPFTEFLTYGFDERLPSSATAYLQWEHKRIPLQFEVPNVNELYVTQMRTELRGWPGFNYQNWQTAAQFAADHRVNLDEALAWADRAIYEPFRNAAQGREDFSTFQTKSAVFEAMGRQQAADSVIDRAVRLPGTEARSVYRYTMRTLQRGRKDRALQLASMNRERHPDATFWTHLGLARVHTALDNPKAAITSWEVVLRNVPPDQVASRPAFERALEALRSNR